MFAVCDVSKPLSEAFFCRSSYVDTLRLYDHYFPRYRKVAIYRDLRSQGSLADLQLIDVLSNKKIKSLLEKIKKDTSLTESLQRL